jgi:DnaJ-class molecular chaperone
MKYKDILEARELLELPERASMDEIKSNYRRLVSLWHPDRYRENKEKSEEMTRKIIAAYEIITAYCENYKYSFAQEEVKRYLSVEEWWFDKFGNDPLWGKP